ncbi:GyrI-like domain-containing protein [Paraflavitalea pollutisoli]|uniref:GyrI-like domain-containing protein n=1 Tax=Paraflavitalea pollutisoli TaxID=3034143 RepID=UPI0023EC32B3|nr:GyrI-like domain-containing protein [Paraflavitalea sp. H1-2-19X]
MNRLVIALIMGLIIFLIVPYLYIPSIIRKSMIAIAPAAPSAAQVALLDESHWKNWWPYYEADSSKPNNGTYYYNGHPFRAGKKFVSGIELISDHAGDSTKGLLLFIPHGKDSVRITWELVVNAGKDPITRMLRNKRSKQLQKDMSVILQKIATYVSNPENIYGIKVEHRRLSDSLLLMTRTNLPHDPTLTDVYNMASTLQQYAAKTGATVANAPMLHVRQTDRNEVEVMVALPINKVVNGAGRVEFKRMYPGNVLITEIQGGPYTINKAFQQLQQYAYDNQYTSPAIPFESLVTDRTKEADTTKWITRIYYPVF